LRKIKINNNENKNLEEELKNYGNEKFEILYS